MTTASNNDPQRQRDDIALILTTAAALVHEEWLERHPDEAMTEPERRHIMAVMARGTDTQEGDALIITVACSVCGNLEWTLLLSELPSLIQALRPMPLAFGMPPEDMIDGLREALNARCPGWNQVTVH